MPISEAPRVCVGCHKGQGCWGGVCLLWETRLAPGRSLDTGQSSRGPGTTLPAPSQCGEELA